MFSASISTFAPGSRRLPSTSTVSTPPSASIFSDWVPAIVKETLSAV